MPMRFLSTISANFSHVPSFLILNHVGLNPATMKFFFRLCLFLDTHNLS